MQRQIGENNRNAVWYDPVLEAGAILIDQDAYSTGLDRIYDVKGLNNMHVEIKNTGVANNLTFRIEGASKEFSVVSDLVDADHDEVILNDVTLSPLTSSILDIIDLSPESTAIRIRVKRAVTLLDTTLGGRVSVN